MLPVLVAFYGIVLLYVLRSPFLSVPPPEALGITLFFYIYVMFLIFQGSVFVIAAFAIWKSGKKNLRVPFVVLVILTVLFLAGILVDFQSFVFWLISDRIYG
jgi:hypothetical protein